MTTMKRDLGRFTTGGAVVAATCAALCCAGLPIIVSILAATGLGFLRNDAVLLPVILVAIGIALWGFWRSRRVHGSAAPLLLASVGGIALIAGVVLLHGIIAKAFIGAGSILLLIATIWNARLPQACDVPIPLMRSRG